MAVEANHVASAHFLGTNLAPKLGFGEAERLNSQRLNVSGDEGAEKEARL
jgi:hypothetical protein